MPRYPALYQVNTRITLRRIGPQGTLDDLPDAFLDRIAAAGFDWVWFLGCWQTGEAGRAVSRADPRNRAAFAAAPGASGDDDIIGSCFAVTGYTVHEALGGAAAMARLRERLHGRGIRLMLDFIPNHVALDHPWVASHPEYFVPGDEAALAREPRNYTRAGGRVLAHGRDPNFDGWGDTLQLDYSSPRLRAAMLDELRAAAARCDGLRCDMAMLILPDVFERTWGRRMDAPFWPGAIAAVRAAWPGFTFLAEVYWDREWDLIQQGFDYCYDKRLYDRLRGGRAGPVRDHLRAPLDYQDHMARFLENHDEPRAAATFPPDMHRAAALITFLAPGFRFFHQGQAEGFRTHVSMHLGRGPDEPVDHGIRAFYDTIEGLLRLPLVRDGDWRLLDCQPAWGGNPTHDAFIAMAWGAPGGDCLVVVVNYGPTQAQCYVRLPSGGVTGLTWRLDDLLTGASYERHGDALAGQGLYVDLPPWGAHVFRLT